MTRISVLFVVPSLRFGGAERVISTIASRLDQSRFDATLIVFNLDHAAYLDSIAEHVQVINLDSRRLRHSILKLLTQIWRIKPKIILSTLGHVNVGLAALKPLLPGKTKLIGRETTILSLQDNSRVLSFFYRNLYRKLDAIVSQSCSMSDDLIAHFNVPEERIVRIPNPVDVEGIRLLAELKPPLPIALKDGDTHLVAAGRLSKEKGFDILLKAIAKVEDKSVFLTIVGDGLEKENLISQTVRLGINDRVHFAGYCRNPFAWFACADAFVISSRYDGFPNALLEALALGAPVIATPSPGGTREILQGVANCVIAENVSPAALASAIEKWLNTGRKRVDPLAVKRYRQESVISEYENLFCHLLHG